MVIKVKRTKHNLYRTGNRFSYQETRHSLWVGYFERLEYDETTSWHWTWSQWTNQDKHAQQWITGELSRLNAREA